MRVLKVRVTAPAASFRYPHFLIGQQLTFEMPPPSTIYGHVASAIGELPSPDSFRFAYCFSYSGRGNDLEHQHIVTAGGSRSTFADGGQNCRIAVDVTVQPHKREFLFRPELTLYLDDPMLERGFLEPTFCVSLGRSQDLATILSCEVIELEQQGRAYFEDTLLPFSMRGRLSKGATVLMPQHIGAPPDRVTTFSRYITLRGKAYCGIPDEPDKVANPDKVLNTGTEEVWWVDLGTTEWQGARRGLYFHSFV